MGIFGALTTAVTGMRAQSFALENISGNIANSQTTAFKREDTSFVDLIPDNQPSKQLAGTVIANARATNTVQGDLQSTSISTFMAINGSGFFVVEKPQSFTDGLPVFDGIDLYTRRGDFQPNKDGYLVNGAGNYLMGIPVDPTTGNLVGSVPTLLKFQNDFLPAQATTAIDYRANLPSYPFTAAHDVNVPGSELLNPATFSASPVAGPPQPAKITGIGAAITPDAHAIALGNNATALVGTDTLGSLGINNGDTFTVNDGTTTYTYTVVDKTTETVNNLVSGIDGGAAAVSASLVAGKIQITADNYPNALTIGGNNAAHLAGLVGFVPGNTSFASTNLLTQSAVSAGQTLTIKIGANPTLTVTFGPNSGANEVESLNGVADGLNAALGALVGGTASVNPLNGNVTITASNMTDTITIGGTATASNFGIQTLSALPSNGTVVANDLSNFLNQSSGGGAVTAYDISGSPVNIQVRWAKIASALYGGTDTWNMFYQVNSNATGTQVAWQNAGVDYTFGPNGQMLPLVANVTINNMVVNGVALGSVTITHGSGGITQFADANGTVQVNLLQQNGFPAGSLQSVAVNDKGRVVGSYSNGRTIDLAEITLANFNGANSLKRLDGGAFAVTDESGAAIFGAAGKIVGSSLEGSNTDIADEFTKLIVTQQAYSANTKVITTSNQMVQDLLNMLR